jgi:hypothetical protein
VPSFYSGHPLVNLAVIPVSPATVLMSLAITLVSPATMLAGPATTYCR